MIGGSLAISLHDNADCSACKGALANQLDHYALGRLRMSIARELGLNRDVMLELDLRSLFARWRAKRAEWREAAA